MLLQKLDMLYYAHTPLLISCPHSVVCHAEYINSWYHSCHNHIWLECVHTLLGEWRQWSKNVS